MPADPASTGARIRRSGRARRDMRTYRAPTAGEQTVGARTARYAYLPRPDRGRRGRAARAQIAAMKSSIGIAGSVS